MSNAPSHAIGLDLGTSTWVAVVVPSDGQRASTVVSRPAPFDEHGTLAASEAIGLARDLVRTAAGRVDGRVGHVGVAGMAEAFGAVREGRAVGTVHSWTSETGPASWALRPTGADTVDRTGLPHGPVAGVIGLRRLADEIGGEAHLLSVPDLVAWSMTGVVATVPSLATRTGLFDRRRLDWDDTLVRAAGLDRGGLPLVHAAPPLAPVVGFDELRGALAGAVGHDHLVAAFAAGADRAGSWVTSIGTVEVMLTIVDQRDAGRLRLDEAGRVAVGPHVVPGLAYLGAAVGFTGTRLDELATTVGGFPELDRAFVAGEPDVVAAFDGLAEEADVVCRLLAESVTDPPERIIATGNGARSAALLAARAERLGIVHTRPPVDEATATGAALLARSAAL